MKLFVFGTGKFAERWLGQFGMLIQKSSMEIVGYLDNNPLHQGGIFRGRRVYSPDILKSMDFDSVVILVGDSNYEPIWKQLAIDYRIPVEKIKGLVWILEECMRSSSQDLLRKKLTRPIYIYDCFPFFNELELLHYRLKTLSPYVNFFVIVEMNQNHRGEEKPYYFLEHREKFREYLEQIIYIQPQNIPVYRGDGDWSLENFQRNAIYHGLQNCEPEDIVCISDLDEIPNLEIFHRLRQSTKQQKQDYIHILLDSHALSCEQDFYYYNFQYKHKVKWNGSIFVKYKNIPQKNLQIFREMRGVLPSLTNAGWHLSHFGNAERIKKKTNSTADGMDVSIQDIRQAMQLGKDIYGREGSKYEMECIDVMSTGIPNVEWMLREYPQFMHVNV